MNRWCLLGVGLGAYTLALLASAPATLVDAALQNTSQGTLRLAEAQGTLWSGSGLIEIRDTRARTGVAKEITWRVAPESLLRGHLACEVRLERASERFPLTLAMSRIELANANISLPASVLGLGVEKLAVLGLTGEVRVHVERLSISRDALAGNATLQWHAAGSALTQVSPLGDYELRLDGQGNTVNAILRTIEGPLRLDGEGSWTRGARPVFLAMAHVLPRDQPKLAPLLRLIAVERGAGSFELRLN